MNHETLSERIDGEFFIDTSGKIIKLKLSPEDIDSLDNMASLHSTLARKILNDDWSIIDPQKILNDKGYIIFGRVWGTYPPHSYKLPTQSQIDILFDLGYKYKGYDEIMKWYYFIDIKRWK